MPASAPTTAHTDDPALLRIEGPIATITLNRAAAFNSIDLSIATKLEQLGLEVEANELSRLREPDRLARIERRLRMLGYTSVAVDEGGYRRGNLNHALKG